MAEPRDLRRSTFAWAKAVIAGYRPHTRELLDYYGQHPIAGTNVTERLPGETGSDSEVAARRAKVTLGLAALAEYLRETRLQGRAEIDDATILAHVPMLSEEARLQVQPLIDCISDEMVSLITGHITPLAHAPLWHHAVESDLHANLVDVATITAHPDRARTTHQMWLGNNNVGANQISFLDVSRAEILRVHFTREPHPATDDVVGITNQQLGPVTRARLNFDTADVSVGLAAFFAFLDEHAPVEEQETTGLGRDVGRFLRNPSNFGIEDAGPGMRQVLERFSRLSTEDLTTELAVLRQLRDATDIARANIGAELLSPQAPEQAADIQATADLDNPGSALDVTEQHRRPAPREVLMALDQDSPVEADVETIGLAVDDGFSPT